MYLKDDGADIKSYEHDAHALNRLRLAPFTHTHIRMCTKFVCSIDQMLVLLSDVRCCIQPSMCRRRISGLLDEQRNDAMMVRASPTIKIDVHEVAHTWHTTAMQREMLSSVSG